jgi:hypothetical protein
MHNLFLAAAAVVAVAALGSPSPASAGEFPYCIQGTDSGYPGDCQYRSYAECLATASGRSDYCGINPRFAFAQQHPRRRF